MFSNVPFPLEAISSNMTFLAWSMQLSIWKIHFRQCIVKSEENSLWNHRTFAKKLIFFWSLVEDLTQHFHFRRAHSNIRSSPIWNALCILFRVRLLAAWARPESGIYWRVQKVCHPAYFKSLEVTPICSLDLVCLVCFFLTFLIKVIFYLYKE